MTRTSVPEEVVEVSGEGILFVGHWDHLGVGEEVDGDDIYNGAIDNAIGTAAPLEVALRVASSDTWPQWYPGNEFKAACDAMLESARP